MLTLSKSIELAPQAIEVLADLERRNLDGLNWGDALTAVKKNLDAANWVLQLVGDYEMESEDEVDSKLDELENYFDNSLFDELDDNHRYAYKFMKGVNVALPIIELKNKRAKK